MPKTTTLAPIANPATGEPVAAGTEINLTNEDYAALRADGKVTASEEEQKANAQEAGPEGVYNARTTREDAPTPKVEDAKSKR